MVRVCDDHGFFRGEASPVCGDSGRQILDENQRTRLSKFMSGVLRHFPTDVGLTLDDHGVTLHEAREREVLSEDEIRLLWQLLGQLAPDEVLVRVPEWLAEEKVGYVDGATPTAFVGQITREAEKAILLEETAAAQSLTKLAHRIHQLEQNTASGDDDK